jgi:hypothetical protein
MRADMATVTLPDHDGRLRPTSLCPPPDLDVRSTPPTRRDVFAACHVVADPLRASADAPSGRIDWDATLRLRHDLWALGLGVAEAMDTAQRGMGLGWSDARDLARRTLSDAAAVGGRVVVGVTTDQLSQPPSSLDAVADAYLEQVQTVEELGGDTVLMASRHLAAIADGPDDYLRVYDRVLSGATRPVVLHWLGAMFDPALAGYWGHAEPKDAMPTVLDLIAAHRNTVRGIKVSLLDPALEIRLREQIAAPARVYTGDDFNYVDMIAGEGDHHSDALLGAFAAIPRRASAAFGRLDDGDVAGFRALLEPTVPLSRLIFTAPTQYYKVGVAWLAYLDGRQTHFRMLGGFETGRSLLHLADVLRVAGGIGLFADPEATAWRATAYFATQGIA